MILTHASILVSCKCSTGVHTREEETHWDPQLPDKLWPIASLVLFLQAFLPHYSFQHTEYSLVLKI